MKLHGSDHQSADILQGVKCRDIAPELFCPFDADNKLGKAVKLGREAFTLAVQIRVGNAYIKSGFGSFASPCFDYDTRIVARRPVAVDCDAVSDRGQH